MRRPRILCHGRARVVSKGKPSITDGPFIEAKEVPGGYWMIDVSRSAEQALASRARGREQV